jgi:hypothetical protein
MVLLVDQLVDLRKDRLIVHERRSYRASVARPPSGG